MEHDNARHDPPGKEGARWAGRDDCGPPEHPDLSWGRRSGVHPCQDPPGPAAHPRTDGPPGRRSRPPTARCPGGADQAVRHLAGVLGARRRSGHPHRKTQAPGHRGQIRPTSSGPCTPEPARRRTPAELTPVAMPVPRAQAEPPAAGSRPYSASQLAWQDRAEPDPMRAASRPEGMTATAPGIGREDVDSASGLASPILTEYGRRVGSLGPGLACESADALSGCPANDSSAGSRVYLAPAGVPSRSARPVQEAGVHRSGGQRVRAIPQPQKRALPRIL